MTHTGYYAPHNLKGKHMPVKYEIGQRVVIRRVGEQNLSVREAAIRPYVGQTGEVSDYYWIEPPTGQRFYLYTVRVDANSKDIVLYEDEIEHVPSKKSSRRSLKDK